MWIIKCQFISSLLILLGRGWDVSQNGKAPLHCRYHQHPSIWKRHCALLCPFYSCIKVVLNDSDNCSRSVLPHWIMSTSSSNALLQEVNSLSSVHVLDVVSLHVSTWVHACAPHCQYEQRSGITRRVHVRLWNEPTESQITHCYPHINRQLQCSASLRGGDRCCMITTKR